MHNKKINARRQKVSYLLSRSFTESEIAEQLGVDQSTISRDIQVLKSESQQYVYDLAKSDLAYYYKKSLDGIEEAKKESWRLYNDDKVRVRDKLLALKLIITSEESRFRLLSEGPALLAVKSMEDRLSRIEMERKQQ
jgi:transcriptional regulator with XRE-family HTH domain